MGLVIITNNESYDFDFASRVEKESCTNHTEYELASTFGVSNKTIYDLLTTNCFTNIDQWIDKWSNDDLFIKESLEELEIINLLIEELYGCNNLSQCKRIESKYAKTLETVKTVEELIDTNVTVFHNILKTLPDYTIRESVPYTKISQLHNELLVKQGKFEDLIISLHEAFEFNAELTDL